MKLTPRAVYGSPSPIVWIDELLLERGQLHRLTGFRAFGDAQAFEKLDCLGGVLHDTVPIMKTDDDQLEKGEELDAIDRVFWYAIGIAGPGIIPAILIAIWLDSDWGLLIGYSIWAPCVWFLAHVGIWAWLERIFLQIWHPIGVVLGVFFRAIGAVFILLSSAVEGLISLAIFAFIFLGFVGLLWLGIRQLF